MYSNVLLNGQQIEELKVELSKIIEENMESFSSKLTKNRQLEAGQDFDALFEFSRSEYAHFQKTLQNISQFTFTIMASFDQLWDEVHHRQSKLLELRNSLSSASSFLQDLKAENEQLRERVAEAEAYIAWAEEEKEYMDAIYYDRRVGASNERLSKCVSERTLRSGQGQSLNYEKLKGYIDNLKEERQELEKELLGLAQRYEVKSHECAKANLLVEHLFERLNKSSGGLRDYLDLLSTDNAPRQSSHPDHSDVLKALEKTDHATSASKQNLNSLLEESHFPPRKFHYFDSFTHLHDCPSPLSHQEDHNLSIIAHRETKNARVGTDSFSRMAAATQTAAVSGEHSDLWISINIMGEGNRSRQSEIIQIIEDLRLQEKIESRLFLNSNCPSIVKESDIRTADSANGKGRNGSAISSYYDLLSQRLVSSRIKKYPFVKPNKSRPKHYPPRPLP